MTVMDVDASLFLQQVSTQPNIITVVPSSSAIPNQQQISLQGNPDAISDQAAVIEEDISDSFTQGHDDSRPVIEVVKTDVDTEFDEVDAHDENSNPNSAKKRSSEEVSVLISTKKHASCTANFDEFQINWNKISDNILANLQKMQDFRNQHKNQPIPRSLQMSKADMTGLANSVVDQMRSIDNRIEAKVFERVAQQIFDKYTSLNFVDDDGFGTNKSYIWWKQKMVSHNSYLNRYKQPNQPNASSVQIRRNRNLRAGTIKEYWLKSDKVCPKEVLSVLSRNEPEFLTRDFLETSQSYVRCRLDEDGSLKDVMATLPVLRRRCLLNYHFECATGVSASSLEQYFSAKRSKIIDFSMSNRKIGHLDARASDYDIFKFLCRTLGEKIDDVIILKEMGTKINDISTDCSGPVLVAIDCGNNKRVYYVFAEQVRLSEGTESLVVAITDLMCITFVHNFMYMKQTSKFMEFVQEYFFKILPTTGSKSNATRKGQQQRVVKRIIAAISNHSPNS